MNAGPISAIAGNVYIDGAPVPASDLRVVLDDRWAPYVAAELTVPYTPARASVLNPHAAPAPRLLVEYARHWLASLTLDEVSAELTGLTLDGLSLSGMTVQSWSESWGTPWDSGYRAPDRLIADVALRGRRVDHRAQTMTLRLASDELLVQDVRAELVRPDETAANRAIALIDAAGVGTLDRTAGLGSLGYTVLPQTAVPLTTDLWAAATQGPREAGFRVWCDENRQWQASMPPAFSAVGALSLTRVSGAQESTDRDSEFADVIVFRGRGVTPAGVALTATATYPSPLPPAPYRVAYVEQDFGTVSVLPMPSAFELSLRLAALQASSRELVIEAVPDPTLRPGVSVTTGPPSLPALGGVVSRVELAITTNPETGVRTPSMTVTLRDVRDV